MCQDSTCLFYLIKESIHLRIKKSVTNFRKPLEVGLKLTITLRHLPLERPTPSCSITGWLALPPSANFIPHACRAILAEFQDKYLHCPDSPDEWKRVENGWDVPHAVGVIDGKHITILTRLGHASRACPRTFSFDHTRNSPTPRHVYHSINTEMFYLFLFTSSFG